MPDRGPELRTAIAQGQYERANELWQEWFRALHERIEAGTLTAEEWGRMAELYRWARPVLLAARTQLAAQVNTLHVAGVYGHAPEVVRPSLIRGSF
ncbi:MAG TPA: hypothetical protein VMD51_00850 [Mycobacterium sp.]|nr:hypothetical protein [Mycobacterium sp.]